MSQKNKWTIFYLAVFFAETFLIAWYVHATEPLRYPLTTNLLVLSGLVSSIFLIPFLLILRSGFSRVEAYMRRAVGKSFLLWIIFVTLPLLISGAGIFSRPEVIIYFFYLLCGFFLIWFFHLPYPYAILNFIFPGISLLYFLISGEITREKERASL